MQKKMQDKSTDDEDEDTEASAPLLVDKDLGALSCSPLTRRRNLAVRGRVPSGERSGVLTRSSAVLLHRRTKSLREEEDIDNPPTKKSLSAESLPLLGRKSRRKHPSLKLQHIKEPTSRKSSLKKRPSCLPLKCKVFSTKSCFKVSSMVRKTCYPGYSPTDSPCYVPPNWSVTNAKVASPRRKVCRTSQLIEGELEEGWAKKSWHSDEVYALLKTRRQDRPFKSVRSRDEIICAVEKLVLEKPIPSPVSSPPDPKEKSAEFVSQHPSQELEKKSEEPKSVFTAKKKDSKKKRKAINSEVQIQCQNGEKRVLRSTCDWSESAFNGDHLWAQSSATGELCYVGDDFCCRSGPRMRCSACKVICHTGCIASLDEKVKLACKPSFRDVGPRQYREHTETDHHWVHRRSQKGRCKTCLKSFQSKLLFGSKEIVAISCSWCKAAFHNKETCFDIAKFDESCNLGLHHSIVVPPSWIVKLPRRGSFKSSLRKSPKKRSSTKKKTKEKVEKDCRPFAIKPIPSSNIRPVIVFINPKSGGNQGAKLLQKFQWLLNPRQVFDLTQADPKQGLEMFRKVQNLRVLACGGDGTVGWILNVLDEIDILPPPSVGVLPLGTGNDLARALGWGGGYTDEPISKILCNIADGEIKYLDRWRCDVQKNPDGEPSEDGKDNLPLNMLNNYFSFGVDAHIALEFHEAREANPQKFNSRLRNKMFYGQAGASDLIARKWRKLVDFCTLECDGKDMTPMLKKEGVHAVVFLNIPSYCSGTHPWNRNVGETQSTDDGLIEVVGLTTYQMPLLQAGGHGTAITQCKTARLVTRKTIPMQVDGEACKLNPSIINIYHYNKAAMITKKKAKVNPDIRMEQLRLQVSRISMSDYEQHHYDKDRLREASSLLGTISIDQDADLDQVRKHINSMPSRESTTTATAETVSPASQPLAEKWCFLDSCTAERFFRIDRAQEHLHYATDICNEDLFVLDPHMSASKAEDEGEEGVEQEREQVEEEEEDGDRAKEILAEVEERPTVCDVEERSSIVSRADSTKADSSYRDAVFDPEYFDSSQLLEKTSGGLVKAAKHGDLKTLKGLHEEGFSLMSIDSLGQTALHHAAKNGHKDIVSYIIASAPPEILNIADAERCSTALHLAASHRRRTVCSMLIAAGASLSLADAEGQTAKTLALKAEDADLANYLESQEQLENVMHRDVETTV